MKKFFSTAIFTVLIACAMAQAPQRFSFQAVIRDNQSQPLINSPVGIKTTILQGTPTGTVVYREIYHPNPQTNANGLVTLEIGTGLVLFGVFSNINWAAGPYFIATEADPTGGTNYTITGTSQLMSVPYALHAKAAESITGGITETDPVFTASPSYGITGANITNWNSAFGWGNHATAGYAPAVHTHSAVDITSGTLPVARGGTGATTLTSGNVLIGNGTGAVSTLTRSGIDTRASFPPDAHTHSAADITSGVLNIARIPTGTTGSTVALGNHVHAQYLTAETDPVYNASPASGITGTNITNWNSSHTHSTTNTGSVHGSTTLGGNLLRLANPSSVRFLRVNADNSVGTLNASDFRTAIGAGTGTLTSIATGNGITGGTITTTGTLGLTGQALALHNLSANGIISRTGAGTVAARAITAGTGITITNGDGVSGNPTIAAKTYAIGDFAHGGIVFWVDATGQHGLVCAKTDQSTGVRWYAGTYGNTRALGDGPLAGRANTSIIIAAHVAIGDDGFTYAARKCNELQITEGSKTYGDWYLPSKGELNLMYINRVAINATAVANGGNGFASTWYWSSSECLSDGAWAQYLTNGGQGCNYKDGTYYVRAVRAF